MPTLKMKVLREKKSQIIREGPEPRALGYFFLFCFVFLAFSAYEEMVLLWAENVDLNTSRTSYALLEQYEWQLRQKRGKIINKNRRSKGQEMENWRGREKENKEMKGLF